MEKTVSKKGGAMVLKSHKGCEIVQWFKDAAADDRRFDVLENGHVIAENLFTIDDAIDAIDEMSAFGERTLDLMLGCRRDGGYIMVVLAGYMALILTVIMVMIGQACAPTLLKNMGVCPGTFTRDDSSNEAYAFWDYGVLSAGGAPNTKVKNWFFVRGHCTPAGVNK